jgi:hypothetical protein
MNVMKTCGSAHWLAMVAGVMLTVAGCGPGAADRCDISGSVTLDGKPVDGGNIQIEPLDAKQISASGALIQNGQYSIPRKSGLAPGEYRVRIYLADKAGVKAVPSIMGGDGQSAAPPRELIPAKYNTESELTIEVRQGVANTFDFALSKNNPSHP